MGELSIKVTIAGRVYPLRINAAEEENLRKAVKMINDQIGDLESNYSVKDKQDLLAMCALQMATESLKHIDSELEDGDNILNQFHEIQRTLDQLLEEETKLA
jgi:cell division protein ZapA (FtsZ GTPase activity inhibitor)